MDTVKAPFCDEMIARIKEFVSVAVKAIHQELGQAGIGVLDSDLAFKFAPDKDEIKKCIDFGKTMAKRIK